MSDMPTKKAIVEWLRVNDDVELVGICRLALANLETQGWLQNAYDNDLIDDVGPYSMALQTLDHLKAPTEGLAQPTSATNPQAPHGANDLRETPETPAPRWENTGETPKWRQDAFAGQPVAHKETT